MNLSVLLLFFAFLLMFAIIILSTIALWGIFLKAGKRGWEAVIPFYNQYTLYQITWGNGWLFLLTLIPVGGFFVYIMTVFKLAKVFNKGTGFGFGLLFLPLIFTCLLAFGKSSYRQPGEESRVAVVGAAVIGGGIGLIIGLVVLISLLVFSGRTRVDYQTESIRRERTRGEAIEREGRENNRIVEEDRYDDYDDEDKYDEYEEYQDYGEGDFVIRDGRIEGNPFDLTPRPGFEIMQIYSFDGTVVLDVPVEIESGFALDYEWVHFGNHGVSANIIMSELGSNLRFQFMAQIALHADALGIGDWYTDIVLDDEIFEIENGIMQRISFQFDRSGEMQDGFEYHMAFEYQGELVYVTIGKHFGLSGPEVDCYIKTLKYVLGFHHFMEVEMYLCFYCDPANRNEQDEERVEAMYSLTENPFDLAPTEGFQVVQIYNFGETIRLDVPAKVRGTHLRSNSLSFEDDGIRVNVDMRFWGDNALEVLRQERDMHLGIMNELEFFLEVEVDEVSQIENGVMQRITFQYELNRGVFPGVRYMMVFDYLGEFIIVKIEMVDIWEVSNFEELADLYRQMFGVNLFLD